MERTRIDADASLRSLGFDQGAGMLEVELASREVYQYFDVTLGEVVSLMVSRSRGDHFHHVFKPFHQRWRRMD